VNGLVTLSALDEERFGIRSARTNLVSHQNLPTVLNFCRTQNVAFLVARCPVDDLQTVQALEDTGARLMDTLVYYRRDLVNKPLPTLNETAVVIRSVQPTDETAVKNVAASAFRNYTGHYHADPKLDRQKCDEVYISWASRSCTSRELADEMLVAELDNNVVGFLSLRRRNAEETEGPLFCVTPGLQKRAIGQNLIIAGLEWSCHQAQSMLISTQINNIASQKVWCRLGFEPDHAFYTFHLWFD
jgi:predicted N-acetyltransferase YhbS